MRRYVPETKSWAEEEPRSLSSQLVFLVKESAGKAVVIIRSGKNFYAVRKTCLTRIGTRPPPGESTDLAARSEAAISPGQAWTFALGIRKAETQLKDQARSYPLIDSWTGAIIGYETHISSLFLSGIDLQLGMSSLAEDSSVSTLIDYARAGQFSGALRMWFGPEFSLSRSLSVRVQPGFIYRHGLYSLPVGYTEIQKSKLDWIVGLGVNYSLNEDLTLLAEAGLVSGNSIYASAGLRFHVF